MIRLLIVDDEPLVQIGIKSMLDWAELGIEICGTASNGRDALNLIEKYSPQIVITDIKMPIMDGLELMRQCQKKYGRLPLFIVLTSYEEFHLAKEALSLHAIEYLVKFELTGENLKASIHTALDILHEVTRSSQYQLQSVPAETLLFHERFFIMLLHNLFENEEQFRLQAQTLSLGFEAAGYLASYMEITNPKSDAMDAKQQLNFFSSTLQMVKTLLPKYISCYITALDIRHFSIIFLLPEDKLSDYCNLIRNSVKNTTVMLQNYYGASIHGSVGRLVESPLDISASFQDSRQIFSMSSPDAPLCFFDEQDIKEPVKNIFNISIFKNDIVSAYEEYDPHRLRNVFSSIQELFRENPSYFIQALDAASNILYLSISLLPNGEELVSNIFKDNPQSYRCLFTLNSTDQVLQWLNTLFDGLCAYFVSEKKDYKNQIVLNAKKYIRNNYTEKLTLNEVAAAIGITPNYLSHLFKKYSDLGFIEYVNHVKIKEAKKIMAEKNMKIYEIANSLGFDNAFYFSKVFKKVEGCSPSEYRRKQ
ncbi:MAG: response regulator [Clostridiaceae bacterium]|nr:response regulator [Clostridiaceae bacterium]